MPTSAIDGGEGEGDVRGNDIFFSSPEGTLVYRNDDSHTVVDHVRTVSSSYPGAGSAFGFKHTNDVFLQDRDLFRKNADGKYEHVATLVPTGPYTMVDDAAINGRRLISQAFRDRYSANQAALIFDLPTTYTPSAVIATGFESGPSPFNPQFGTFAITTKATGNHVYRRIKPGRRLPRAARQFRLGRAVHRGRHQTDGVLRIQPLGRTRGALPRLGQLLLCDFA